jgi:predicted DCC family thiol-disulfide oxidoreductase YuxK
MVLRKGPEEKILVMFDGVCNLCNGLIIFLIPRDPKGVFVFTPLQSEPAKKILKENTILDPNQLESVVVIVNGRVYQKSKAVIQIFRRLSFPWKILVAGDLLPQSITDCIYDFVGKNRYKWFGRKDKCMLPTPDLLSRFLR